MPLPAKALSFELGPGRDRLIERIRGLIEIDETSSCWNWLGNAIERGYGQMSVPGRGTQRAYRVSYALFKGPLHAGDFTLDHLCRNPRCVNPEHLEEVTFEENLRRRRLDVRGELCPRGHVFVPRGQQRNRRSCKQCFNENQREYLRAYRARKREEAQEREAS